jgi:hypothetical protein
MGLPKLFLYSGQNAIRAFAKNDDGCGSSNRCPFYTQKAQNKPILDALRRDKSHLPLEFNSEYSSERSQLRRRRTNPADRRSVGRAQPGRSD